MKEVSFEGLSSRRKAQYCKILLGMVISGIQVGLLMGVGVLRDVLGDFETGSEVEEAGSDGSVREEGCLGSDISEVGDDEKEMVELREWIREGEAFVDDLEVLREVIGERYSGVGRRRRLRRKRVEREKVEQGWEEKSGVEGSQENADKDLDVPPPIPEKSSRRPLSSA